MRRPLHGYLRHKKSHREPVKDLTRRSFRGVLLQRHVTERVDAVIDQLEYRLSVSGEMSIPLLRTDPARDPLRDHPRFKKLLETRDRFSVIGKADEAAAWRAKLPAAPADK